MILDGSTGFRVGSIQQGVLKGQLDFSGQDKNFYILTQSARIYKLFDVPVPFSEGGRSEHSILIRVNGQYSKQSLPSVDRMTLGGADAVRNLLSSDVSVDTGIYASAQLYWQIPASWDRDIDWAHQRLSEAFRPYVFFDYAYGVQNATEINAANQKDQWFEFTGYGVGLEYNFYKNPRGNFNVHGSVNYARPNTLKFGSAFKTAFKSSIEDEDRIYFDLTFEFDQAGLLNLWNR